MPRNNRREKQRLHQKYNTDLAELKKRVEEFDASTSTASKFSEYPLSSQLLKGLEEAAFVDMTDIQKEAIPVALKGRDILGAAKTGSGKTLAFLIPVLERLAYEKWTDMDGVGALIISPTRELAAQIYEVLVKIGRHCALSAGLVIGGKDYKYEKERVGRMNILIGTPGRILQHMDESASLHFDNLQLLVLDEADRILDMGFRKTLDSIVGDLPPQRQTLLFSATQTKSIKDLARLSLVNPKYISTSSDEDASTPESLQQFYITTPLEEKLDVLWSFIRSHLKCKLLVFFSSSKQVHFVYETFRKMRPGISLLKLHGRQKQKARLETTVKFVKGNHCCLFATDVVARGLDFPAVDWVVQVDCPEDSNTYVHRVGRSARFGRNGKSLLMLTPSEEQPFLKRLEAKKVAVKKLNVKNSMRQSVASQLQSFCFGSPDLKYLGQKAFISYCKSIYVQKDKEVFDVSKVPLEKFAKSLGLPGSPKVKFMENASSEKDIEAIKAKKNASRKMKNLAKTDENGDVMEEKKPRNKFDKMFERKNQSVLSEHYQKMTKEDGSESESDDEDFLTVRRKVEDVDDSELPELEQTFTSKRAMKRALSKKLTAEKNGKGVKMLFDDSGKAHPVYELQEEKDFHEEGSAGELKEKFLEEERENMGKQDEVDRDVEKGKRTEKRRKRKEMEKMAEGYYSDGGEDEEEEEEEGSSDEPDLDRDLEESEEESEAEEPTKKRPNDEKSSAAKRPKVVEIEQPETMEDLEALTEKLINE